MCAIASCEPWRCRHAGALKCGSLFGQIARSCDHRHGLYELSSVRTTTNREEPAGFDREHIPPSPLCSQNRTTHEKYIQNKTNLAKEITKKNMNFIPAILIISIFSQADAASHLRGLATCPRPGTGITCRKSPVLILLSA
jgi:hypothetical protein